MASEMLKGKVTDGTIWYAKDLEDDSSWLHTLSEDQRQEVTTALQIAKSKGATVASIKKEDFPLPHLGQLFSTMRTELDKGYGFSVLRGMPIEGLSIEDIELLYSGITAYFGEKFNQDTKGTLIDHVADRGNDYSDISVRGYTTNEQLTPHCDSGDLVVLLCVRPAKEGGMNNISCTMAVYNEIVENHPEYLEPLYQGFHYNIRGNGPIGPYQDITKHKVPVFCYHDGMLSCRYNQKAILTAEELPGVEPLTQLEKDAINYVAELAMRDDIRFDVHLEAGDIAFLNNNTVLHNRDAFVDYEEPEKKRLLLRQWVNLDGARELPLEFADHYNTGPRRGPAIHEEVEGERIR